MKYLEELFGLTIIAISLLPRLGHTLEYCMDKHGSSYSASTCDNRDITPEYMYNTREQQMQMNDLNMLSAQALENIARAGTPLPNNSVTTMDNSQAQGQGQSQASRNSNTNNSRSNSNASSINLNSLSSNTNNTNNNTTNANVPLIFH